MLSNQTEQRRFSGVGRLYSEATLQRFGQSHILIIGLGGVGSWVVEAFARSAIGHLTLVDMDHIAESNINRQIQASSQTLGQSKGLALKERIRLINPKCKVSLIDDFISPDNQAIILNQGQDWVVDCIDDFRSKAALIYYCRRNKYCIITVGGAGGMVDPSLIKITDLSRTQHDPLLAKTRKLLRQNYHFSSNVRRRFAIPCVYSDEQLRYPDGKGSTSFNKPPNTTGLNCALGFGSSMVVTASMGIQAAAYVLNKL